MSLAAAWSWRLVVVGAAVWFTVTFLSRLTLVVVPVVLALLLTALLHRPAAYLRRLLPRALAGLVVLLGALVVAVGLGWFIAVRVQGHASSLVIQSQSVLSQIRDRLGAFRGSAEVPAASSIS